jgi:hypothetical protein
MNRFTFISVLIILVFVASLSLAGIPKMINYQGMLTQSNGTTPVKNGNYPILFSIYKTSSGGSALWSHTYNLSVTNGLFNVILGDSGAPINLPFDHTYWLGIKVGDDSELSPRIQLTSVGYAYWAGRADTADYALSSPSGPGDYTWTFRITDGGDTTISTGGRWGIARYGNTLYGNADSTHVNLGVACTTGTNGQNQKYCTTGGGYRNTASRNGATVGGGLWNAASGSYATVGGGWGNVASGQCATVGGGLWNTASGVFSFAAGRRAKANHAGTFVWADYGVDADFASTGNNQFLIRASGGVGIGTTTPAKMLDVNGDIKVSGTITSTVSTGTAPFNLSSGTKCDSLNADMVDGVHASSFMQIRADGIVSAGASTTLVLPHYILWTLQLASGHPAAGGVCFVQGFENDSYIGVTYIKYNGDGTSGAGGAEGLDSSTTTLVSFGSGSYLYSVTCPGENTGDHNIVLNAAGVELRYRLIY